MGDPSSIPSAASNISSFPDDSPVDAPPSASKKDAGSFLSFHDLAAPAPLAIAVVAAARPVPPPLHPHLPPPESVWTTANRASSKNSASAVGPPHTSSAAAEAAVLLPPLDLEFRLLLALLPALVPLLGFRRTSNSASMCPTALGSSSMQVSLVPDADMTSRSRAREGTEERTDLARSPSRVFVCACVQHTQGLKTTERTGGVMTAVHVFAFLDFPTDFLPCFDCFTC